MIHTVSQSVRHQTQITNGEQITTADTTPDKGGGSMGFRPHELLEAALASCMNITLRMSAEKHAIPLSSVSVSVSLNRTSTEGPTFECSVNFHETLPQEQKERLLSAMERCPVRTTLSQPLNFKLSPP
jgi:putative redox protein